MILSVYYDVACTLKLIFVSLNVLCCHLNPHCISVIIFISYVCIFIYVLYLTIHNNVLVKVEINYLLTYLVVKVIPSFLAIIIKQNEWVKFWQYRTKRNIENSRFGLTSLFMRHNENMQHAARPQTAL